MSTTSPPRVSVIPTVFAEFPSGPLADAAGWPIAAAQAWWEFALRAQESFALSAAEACSDGCGEAAGDWAGWPLCEAARAGWLAWAAALSAIPAPIPFEPSPGTRAARGE